MVGGFWWSGMVFALELASNDNEQEGSREIYRQKGESVFPNLSFGV
jgi:hypothetical protein